MFCTACYAARSSVGLSFLVAKFWLLGVISMLVTFALTMSVERLAPRIGLVKSPNERSSHVKPTPQGGGLGIAIAGVGAALLLFVTGHDQFWLVACLTGALATLGFIDDVREISPATRFLVQAVVLCTWLVSYAHYPPIHLPRNLVLDGPLLLILLLVVGLWWINLFNFMDGIDGIAGSQTVLILTGATLAALLNGLILPDGTLSFAVAICTATVGFLLRNWPPAKIFMGDAGSNFLALAIFILASQTIQMGNLGYSCWLILVSAFVVDATVTLVRRAARGERPWHAHRRHAYQQLSRQWGHRRTTLTYAAITSTWATPLACLSVAFRAQEWWFVAIAVFPMVFLAIWAGAGEASERAVSN